MNFALQDKHFDALREAQTPVTIVLMNGIKLYGRIESFDQYVVTVTDDVPQLVYKHAIAHVQSHRPNARPKPTRPVERPASHDRPVLRARQESHDHLEPRDYSTPSSPAAAKTPVIVRKKLRTIARTPVDPIE